MYYRPKIDKDILSARVALKRGALCWEYRVKWQDCDEEFWALISDFFEAGGLAKRWDTDNRTGGATADITHAFSWRDASTEAPPELKALIAEHVPRATLANFCATSREEYLHLMFILYRSTAVPDVWIAEMQKCQLERLASLLLTLGSTKSRRNLGPYPATLVRELANVAIHWQYYVLLPSWFEGALQKALRCTADYAPHGKSQLRTFHWDAGRTTIFRLLSERPAFENLTELSVRWRCSTIPEFKFLQIPGLKSLVYKERSNLCNDDGPVSQIFRVSPGHIPTTLKLDIWWDGTHIPSLEKAVNSLRLPCLEVTSIHVKFVYAIADPDFNPFLEAHPTLYDVSVVLGSQPLCDDALPLLRTFTGRADDFLKVCDRARPIRNLAVTLFPRVSGEGCTFERGRAAVAALTKTPNLRRLAIVNRYDADGSDSESYRNSIYMHGVDHSTVRAIGQVCPGITHLELHLKSAKKADVKALANLHELQWIRAHFWITVPNGGGPVANMYDEDFLDANDSADGSDDENDHGPPSFYNSARDQARLLLRVFRNHIDSHLLPMAPKLLEVEIEVVVAGEHFDEKQIDNFSFRIVHWGGKRLTMRT